MQRLGIGNGLLSFRWIVGEHAAIRSLCEEMEIGVRRLGVRSGVRAGSVSKSWLRQHDAEQDKRGEDR